MQGLFNKKKELRLGKNEGYNLYWKGKAPTVQTIPIDGTEETRTIIKWNIFKTSRVSICPWIDFTGVKDIQITNLKWYGQK